MRFYDDFKLSNVVASENSIEISRYLATKMVLEIGVARNGYSDIFKK